METTKEQLKWMHWDVGLRLADMGRWFEVGPEKVRRIMQGGGIPRRPSGARPGCRGNKGQWRQTQPSYRVQHSRVAILRGRPKKCEFCGTNDPTVCYDWHNKTGDYDDLADYAGICKSCHRQRDKLHKRPRSGGYGRGRTLPSRFRGVCFQFNAWKAQIGRRGKHYFLGTFETETDAARAYDVAALALYGPNAYLNFPADTVQATS